MSRRSCLALSGSAVIIAAAGSTALFEGPSAVGRSSASAVESSGATFSVLTDMDGGSRELSPAQREALSGLGKGYGDARASGSALSPASVDQGRATGDARTLGEGGGALERVDHPAGVTVVLARAGNLFCFNDAPTGGGTDAGGGCAPIALDPAAPPASVTKEDDGERVVAFVPDGAADVVLTEADGSRKSVTVIHNIAAVHARSSRALSWRDATGREQRIRFHVGSGEMTSRSHTARATRRR